MSTENIRAFFTAAEANPQVKQQINELGDASPEAAAQFLARLSAGTGHPFTAEEFLAATQKKDAELSEEEIAGVAGGRRSGEYVKKDSGSSDFGQSVSDFFGSLKNLF